MKVITHTYIIKYTKIIKKKQPTSYISTLKIDKFQKTSLDTISGILVTASYCL